MTFQPGASCNAELMQLYNPQRMCEAGASHTVIISVLVQLLLALIDHSCSTLIEAER